MPSHLPARSTRARRRYTDDYKAEVVAESCQPGASVAQVALRHQLNANLLHRWIRDAGDCARGSGACAEIAPVPTATAFVPVTLSPQPVTSCPERNIVITVKGAQQTVRIEWPVTDSEACIRALVALTR